MTAEAKALPLAEPLQLPAASGFELHPLARMGIARSDPMTDTVFQALILAMRSSPYAERRWQDGAPKVVGRTAAAKLHASRRGFSFTGRGGAYTRMGAWTGVYFSQRCDRAAMRLPRRGRGRGRGHYGCDAAMAARIASIPFAIRSSLVA